ncbi:MAG TPA: metallophosphoesterase [Terriglobales bacterium]|nr:metallophosphoesterase [Terriglobales bacterium]
MSSLVVEVRHPVNISLLMGRPAVFERSAYRQKSWHVDCVTACLLMDGNMLRIAAMADLHYGSTSQGRYAREFSEISEKSDVLLLCGDLVNYGLAVEAEMLVKSLAAVVRRLPVLAVLGNHEFESGNAAEVKKILAEGGVTVLDGECCDVRGVGFAGVKGFAGGFGKHRLEPWGEEAIKAFVREAAAEAAKLETALARLSSSQRVVLLHYSPISSTVVGEPSEIFPFMGSSRLEEPLNRHPVAAVFHGHAHHGSIEGRTQNGTPVYNVAVEALERVFPNRPPYRALELPASIKPSGS